MSILDSPNLLIPEVIHSHSVRSTQNLESENKQNRGSEITRPLINIVPETSVEDRYDRPISRDNIPETVSPPQLSSSKAYNLHPNRSDRERRQRVDSNTSEIAQASSSSQRETIKIFRVFWIIARKIN